jgi:hypothetical protein
VAELPGTHDLGPYPRIVLLDEGVVDAAATAGLPPPGGEHPFVQPIAGVTEMCVVALTFAGAETIERDGEVVDAYEGHGLCSFDYWGSVPGDGAAFRIGPHVDRSEHL